MRWGGRRGVSLDTPRLSTPISPPVCQPGQQAGTHHPLADSAAVWPLVATRSLSLAVSLLHLLFLRSHALVSLISPLSHILIYLCRISRFISLSHLSHMYLFHHSLISHIYLFYVSHISPSHFDHISYQFNSKGLHYHISISLISLFVSVLHILSQPLLVSLFSLFFPSLLCLHLPFTCTAGRVVNITER